MPLFDMPLDQLREYGGANPRPADMADYWERALDEMRSVDARIELVRKDYSASFAECFDLYFTGVRGARIHAKYLRPVGVPEPHPAVVLFHGYSGSSGDWFDKLGYAAQGFSVAALDCRGQGGLSEDTGGVKGNTLNGHIIRGLDGSPDDLLFRHIYLDCAQLAGIVMDMPDVDPTRVGATGGSQGGGLTLACVALEPRMKRAAPVFPFLCDYKRVWEIDLAVAAYEELKQYFRRFDPRHEREDEVFNKLGYIDNQHLASRIRAETLFFTGLMDTVCPPSSQFAAYNKITAPKDMVIYPDFGHEGLPDSGERIFEFMAGL
jgi:cephalosporin-C deacetylase